mgnify:FL=1
MPRRGQTQLQNSIKIDNDFYPTSWSAGGTGGNGGVTDGKTSDGSAGTNSNNHIFNDTSLPLCGGGGGGGRIH